MKKKLLLVCMAIFSLFSVSATVVPTTSTAGNDVWYHIKCSARNTPTAVWLTGAADGGNLTVSDFTTADESQLWKVVVNGTGTAFVNKQFGTYMNTDVANTVHITAVTAAPVLPLQLLASAILPGGVLVMDANAVVDPTSNSTTGATFTFYAAGSGYQYHPANLNGNYNPPLVHSSVIFMTNKEVLQSAITDATTLLNSTSEGANPGQFSPESRNGLSLTIIDAQSVSDNPASTNAQFMTAFTDLNAIVAIYKTSGILPQLSGTTDVWYYIQGTRPVNSYLTAPAAGVGTQVKDLPVIPDDTQLWKLVTNGDGFAMQNKASQEYLVTDVPTGTNLPTQTAMPTKALRFIISPETFNKTSRFWIENTTSSTEAYRLHAGGSGNGWGLMNWTGGATDNCTWLFMDYAAAQRDFLKDKLTAINLVANSTQVGTNPGQVTLAGMNEFKAVIAAAQAVYDNPDLSSDDYIAANLSLAPAKATLKTKASLPIISTDASSTYYTLSGTRPAVTSVIANVSTTDTLRYQVMKSEDAELWRFVANGTTGIAIQNKATSKYIACDSANYSDLKTQTAMPVRPLKFIITDEIAAGAYRFIIENDSVVLDAASFRLHAGLPVPMNYADDAADNCGWLIADNSQAIKNAFNAIITAGDALYAVSATIEGSAYAQYPAAARTAFSTVLTNAKAANLNTMTIVELQTAYAALTTDWTTFQASRISDINMLVSTAAAPKWFYITGCNSLGVAGYNKRIANVAGSVYGVTKADADNNQKWRFELNPIGDNTILIINKTANEEITYPGSSSTTFTVGAGGTFFALGVHDDGISTVFLTGGDRLHCAGGLNVVGWYDNANPNSAWRFDATADNTSVKDVTVTKLNIRSNNGIITVDGVDNFEVYSVMGQRLNVKAVLNKGVYIVKTAKVTQKYIVR